MAKKDELIQVLETPTILEDKQPKKKKGNQS